MKNVSPVIEPNTIEKNPVGLSNSQVKETIRELDRLVSSFFVQFHQYQKHHWVVEGPQFRDLHLYLESAYNAVHVEVDAIAERMTVLGGVPTSNPVSMANLAIIEHEPEGVFDTRTMLQNDLENEQKLAGFIRNLVPATTDKEDFATQTLLKKTLMSVEERAHNLDHYLASFSLEPSVAYSNA